VITVGLARPPFQLNADQAEKLAKAEETQYDARLAGVIVEYKNSMS
jgi:hypothetical protein